MVIYESTERITSDLIRQLHGWWQGLADGAIPDRAQLDPVDLKHLLPNLMISDVEQPFRIRFRLVGTMVVEATGVDFTGRYLDEMRPPAPGEPHVEEYRTAYERKAPLFGASTIKNAMGAPYTYEFGILPLLKGEPDIAQFIALEDYFGIGLRQADLQPWRVIV